MIIVRILYKLSIVFLCLSVVFFSFSLVEITTNATVFAPNTFISSKSSISDKDQLTLDESLNVPYLEHANEKEVYSEFTESSIDPNGFYIRVDKIKLFKAIVKDVDPRYKEVYVRSWEKGVSHGKFTAYPDQIGITYIFGHAIGDKSVATDQGAWFSNMDQVSVGDAVIVYYEGTKYHYEVNEIRAVSPDATGFYTGSSSVAKVRMQYCGPPTGSLAKRTLIDAVLTGQEPI